MDIRKICPAAVNGELSTVSWTQPVPSIAACFVGSVRTAKIASAGALMTVAALTLSSAMRRYTPHCGGSVAVGVKVGVSVGVGVSVPKRSSGVLVMVGVSVGV